MARRNDHLHTETGDDYTPATALVFSMFAMTVLLLALFGAGDHVKTNANTGKVLVVLHELEQTLAQNETLRAEKAALDKEIATLRSRLAELEKVKPGSGNDTTIRDLRARLTEALELSEDYRRRLEAIQKRIDFAQIRVGEVDEATVGPFLVGGSTFAPQIRDRLLGTVAARADQIAALRANRLVFEISTSASRGAGADGTDLDLMESMSWGEALIRAMRPTPLPVGCLAILPTGKLHSTLLHELAVRPGAGKAIDDFEKLLGLKPVPQAIAAQLDRVRRTDRHITVWAQSVATDSCDPAVLAAAVAALKTGK